MKTIVYIALFLGLGLSLLSPIAFAANTNGDCAPGMNSLDRVDCILNTVKPDNAPDPLQIEGRITSANSTFSETVKNVVSIITGIIASFSGLFALIMLLKHSFHFITSNGDSGKMAEAGKGIAMSLGGIIGIIMAYTVVYTLITVIYERLG